MTLMIVLVALIVILLIIIWLLKVKTSYKIIVTILAIIAVLGNLYSNISYYNTRIDGAKFPNYVFDINNEINQYSNNVKYEINNKNDLFITVDVYTLDECWTIRINNASKEYECFYRFSFTNLSGNLHKKDEFWSKVNSDANKVKLQELVNKSLEDKTIKEFYDNGGYIAIETTLAAYQEM